MLPLKSATKLIRTNFLNTRLKSITFITIFLLQVGAMVIIVNNSYNTSSNNNIEENVDFNYEIPESQNPNGIEESTDTINEFIPADDTIDNDLTEEKEDNVTPELDSGTKNPVFSKISSFQGSNLNTQIEAFESFSIENSITNLQLENSFEDSSNPETSTSIDLPGNEYTPLSHSILVDNISATYNYDHVEYESSNYNWLDSSTNLWQSVATSFDVTEPAINLTQIRLAYLKFDSGNLAGEAYITEIIAGNPGNTKIGGQVIDLTLGGGTNTTLSFPNPVTLTTGSYAVVLSETSSEDDENIFRYKYVRDDGIGDSTDESQMWQKSWGGSWASVSRDLFLSYEFISLNPSDYSQARQYASTEEVNLETTVSGNVLEFISDSPVSFDVAYSFAYLTNNPFGILTNFLINNNSVPLWESSFKHDSSPNGAFNINSRNITINNIPSDWRCVKIDQNGNTFSSDPDNNMNIIYTNETSELVLLLGEETDSYSWSIQFISPNYIDSLTLKENDQTVLNSPYSILSSDTLRIIANMGTSTQDSNGSLFIFNPDDVINHFETDVLINSDTLTFNIWDPSSLGEGNGIYSIVIYWIDSSSTKVGFFETNFDLKLQTELSAFTDSLTYSSSQIVHLLVNYSSDLNGAVLSSAKVSYLAEWDLSTGILSQTQAFGLYSVDISALNAPTGLTNITVYASLDGYVSKSVSVPITFIYEETSLSYSVNGTIADNLDLDYHESLSLRINYDSISGPISMATVKVNESLATEELDGSYTYSFDTRTIFPYITSFVLQISANKSNFIAKELIITFNMDEANSNINPLNESPINNSLLTKYFSHTSLDLIEFQLSYQEVTHGIPIQDAMVTNNASSTDFTIGINEENNIWTIQLDPEKIGNFIVSFTFNKFGYQQSSFVLTIQIDSPQTEVLIGGDSQITGNNSVIDVFYHFGTKDNISVLFSYYDNIYNQLLTNSEITSSFDVDSINILEKQLFNGTKELVIQPNAIGNFPLTFSISLYGYQTLIIELSLNVMVTPTDVLQTGHPDFNQTESNITLIYDPSSYNPLLLYVTFNDSIYGDILSNGILDVWSDGINVSILTEKLENGTFIVQLGPLGSGIENITLEYSELYYDSKTISLALEIVIVDIIDDDSICDFLYDKFPDHPELMNEICEVFKQIIQYFETHNWSLYQAIKNNEHLLIKIVITVIIVYLLIVQYLKLNCF